jgi:hypothetical protein
MSAARRAAIGTAALALGTLASASASGLEVGDRMPPSGTVSWAVQAPDASAHRLTLTVLFAANDPVDRAVMPRMTDLARRHPEVAVVGYSADGVAAVKRLCQELGAKIGFPVGAITSVDAFMPPVGLPCALLSDGQGTVVWWGHPLDAPRPLADALAGDLRTPIPPVAPVAPAASSAPPPPPVPPQAAIIGPAAGPMPPPAAPESQPPAEVWEEVQPPAPLRTEIVVDPWWCWNPWPLGWHARVPLPPFFPLPLFGRDGHERGDRGHHADHGERGR